MLSKIHRLFQTGFNSLLSPYVAGEGR